MEKWNSTILTIKKHIYWKRKQVESYNQQKLDLKPGERHLSTLTMVKTTAICNRMRYNLSILVSRALAFFNFCSYYRESCEDSLTKVPMVVVSESNDQSRIAAFSCIIVIADELKKLWGNCVRWFFGAMVASHNFVPSLYLQCLLISSELLHYNGTITRPTITRGRWTVLEAETSESCTGWSNSDTSVSALLRNLQPRHLKVCPQ